MSIVTVYNVNYWFVYAGVKLDNASCEVLEAVLSRVTTNCLDIEKTNLEDEVIPLYPSGGEGVGCKW